ncbi:MAG: type II toxin-antitoxin system HicB family antitoxin [Candidatus Marinimicrobia bacterium]|nr:type II toxin-antitoxin system HicB family antitoxin [Candidatus Neomarinimicrobiota bacterium]
MKKDINYYLALKYNIQSEYNHHDNTWTVFYPDLGRGTCYATANTIEAALKLLEQDKKELFELLLEDGIKIKSPSYEDELPSGNLMLRIPRPLHRDIKEAAKLDGVSVNQFISSIISRKIGELDASQDIWSKVSNLINYRMNQITVQLSIKKTSMYLEEEWPRYQRIYDIGIPSKKNMEEYV